MLPGHVSLSNVQMVIVNLISCKIWVGRDNHKPENSTNRVRLNSFSVSSPQVVK